MNRNCPECGGEADRVIYLGFPMRFCTDEECCTLFGFWSFVAACFPIVSEGDCGEPAFAFYHYDGAYFPAVLGWIRGKD